MQVSESGVGVGLKYGARHVRCERVGGSACSSHSAAFLLSPWVSAAENSSAFTLVL